MDCGCAQSRPVATQPVETLLVSVNFLPGIQRRWPGNFGGA